MLQGPVPEQAPLQPVKTEPAPGVAARLTCVPEVKAAEQDAPQLIPDGELETVPELVPVFVTDSVNWRMNTAVTVVFEFMRTAHGEVPTQADPVQPAKTEPAAGVA